MAIVMIICQIVHAQIHQSKFEYGFHIGTFIYQGDLTPSKTGSFKTPGPMINVFASRVMNSSFSIRGNLAFGKLKGDESKYDEPEFRQHRNFKFSSPVLEFSGLFVWDIRAMNFEERIKTIRPYVFGGVGAGLLKIKREWSQFDAEYFETEPELPNRIALNAQHSVPSIIPVIPVGLGARYSLTQKISVSAEAMYRFIFTDYLDGFGIAANPDNKDKYQGYAIGLIYSPGRNNRLDCPVITY